MVTKNGKLTKVSIAELLRGLCELELLVYTQATHPRIFEKAGGEKL